MDGTSEPVSTPASDTKIVLNIGVYRARLAELGATTAAEGRELARISRTTEYRWKRGGSVPNWQLAKDVAARLKVSERELFVEVAA